MVSGEMARAIDEHLLSASDATVERINTLLRAEPLAPAVGVLVAGLRDDRPTATSLTPVMLGPYLASRLIARRCSFAGDRVGCLYALADAVKAIDAVSIYRWRFVVSESSDLRDMHPAALLLRQSRRFLDGIAALSPDMEEELQWERRILPMA